MAAEGIGAFYAIARYTEALEARGKLVPLLEDWMPPPVAFDVYYPNRKQNPAALEAFVGFLKASLTDEKG